MAYACANSRYHPNHLQSYRPMGFYKYQLHTLVQQEPIQSSNHGHLPQRKHHVRLIQRELVSNHVQQHHYLLQQGAQHRCWYNDQQLHQEHVAVLQLRCDLAIYQCLQRQLNPQPRSHFFLRLAQTEYLRADRLLQPLPKHLRYLAQTNKVPHPSRPQPEIRWMQV